MKQLSIKSELHAFDTCKEFAEEFKLGKGDLVLKVKVEIPKRLTNKQKDLLREFEATTSDREYDNRKNFLDRVKELFQ